MNKQGKKGDCPNCPACGWTPQGQSGAPWYTDPPGSGKNTKFCAPHCAVDAMPGEEIGGGERFRCRYHKRVQGQANSSFNLWDKNQDEVKDWFRKHNLDRDTGHSTVEKSVKKESETAPTQEKSVFSFMNPKTESKEAAQDKSVKNEHVF